MNFTVEITGLDSFGKMTDPARIERACFRTLDRGSQAWADTTKKMPAVSGPRTGYGAKGIPVDHGLLRQGIHNRRISNIAAGVIAPASYASYVRDGTAFVPGRDFFAFALEDFGAMRRIGEIANEELSQAISV